MGPKVIYFLKLPGDSIVKSELRNTGLGQDTGLKVETHLGEVRPMAINT